MSIFAVIKLTDKHIIVIGGGAAGFFTAINAAEMHPGLKVTILEKSNKLLSKVRVSGGGRCNVTNHCFDVNELVKNYPRGSKELKQVFSRFNVSDTIAWFTKRGVELKTEPDNRMFPVSNSSETIIDCFMYEAKKYGIEIKMQEEVLEMRTQTNKQIEVTTDKQKYLVDAVICSSGGHNQKKNYSFIQKTGHTISELIPSLFTINLPGNNIKELMGLSVRNATVRVEKTKHNYTGPVLITHWGLSGPAVLKLSAFAAKYFFDLQYNANININWTGDLNSELVNSELASYLKEKSLVVNTPLYEIPKRLWEFLLEKAEIPPQKPWIELGKKQQNKLAQILTNDVYNMKGKTTFKEEFVTSGGVNLKEIDFKTMQSKLMPNLFFCGEVLDIDGITGGFNFQNAWSTAWVAASSI
ncbi:MAG TPA: NAD(P)/FAD-dependent oxidoreductase [Bacteroidia bacterium]|jgi:predicted Rossmann fold flavoprotein|nr:NAD(P)/FAD-dependent oxidoreductase [Bacteroidia bacterium]